MNRTRIYANVAVFAVLFVVMVGWSIRSVVSVDRVEKPYRIGAEFVNAFGVLPNAEVTYLGVGYGSVVSVDRIEGGVRINMKIERDKKIPAGSTAMISRKSAIGEPYVDFDPPDNETGGPYIEAGDVIPLERTAVPLEFSELLRSASALVESIPPESLETLLTELAIGLEGRSETLRTLAESSDRLAATFAERSDLLDRLATNNTRLTRVVTQHRGSLGSSITDLRRVAETLRAARGDTSVLLQRGSVLMTQAADLVAANKRELDCSIKVLDLLIDETTTPRRLQELSALLDIGPKAFNNLNDVIDREADGPWIRVGNITNTENPPAQYVPPRGLPEVKSPAACVSALQAANVDYAVRPQPSGSTAPLSQLPATGALGVASGGFVLGIAALVTRFARRRSS